MRKPRRANPPASEALASVREAESVSEGELERIESDPEFRRMMRESEEDIKHGRVYTREEVDAILSEHKRSR